MTWTARAGWERKAPESRPRRRRKEEGGRRREGARAGVAGSCRGSAASAASFIRGALSLSISLALPLSLSLDGGAAALFPRVLLLAREDKREDQLESKMSWPRERRSKAEE